MHTKLFNRILLAAMIFLLVGALPLMAQDDGEVQELGTGAIEINFWSGLGGRWPIYDGPGYRFC